MSNQENQTEKETAEKEVKAVQIEPNKIIITGFVNGEAVDVKKVMLNKNNNLCING